MLAMPSAQLVNAYRAQRRGGKGRSATTMKEEDFIERLWEKNTHDTLLTFTQHRSRALG